ncbi:MAG TPA: aspartyl protease family protein [Chitinophagales bacterium]|nr:aspartyl protease family protein [Chitinophagales bacterium]
MVKRFLYSQGLVIISVHIKTGNKKKLPILLAVDTGSHITAISPKTLTKAGAELLADNLVLQGIGQKILSPSAIINFPDFTETEINAVTVAAYQLPEDYSIDGVIGNDILQNFKVTIDYPNQTITFE